MNNPRIPAAILVIMLIAGSISAAMSESFRNQLASVFFTQSITSSSLKDKYNSGQKIKVLIVPGHEPSYGGAEYGILKERDMTLAVALQLQQYFLNDPHFEVVLARDNGGWNPHLAAYFIDHGDDIVSFTKHQKAEMKELISEGKIIDQTDGPQHASAQTDVARRLFGINKWANENKVDITLHLHFNDYYRKKTNVPGIYSGFTIYVPDYQYSNAAATKILALDVFKNLSTVMAVSNQPKEHAGIVDDQDLIAIGQSNTSDGASMLIEYGYIYQPQFGNPLDRNIMYGALAQSTYKGVSNFFTQGSYLTRADK